jgi:hypothetical protein
MLMLTLQVLGHPDFKEPETFRVELGKTLYLKPAVLTRAKQLTIKIEDTDAEKKTDNGGEASKHLDSPSPARNS